VRHISIRSAVYMFLLLILTGSMAIAADEPKPIQLPAPQIDGGKPLMQALKDRHSSRDFSADTLSLQTLSSLLWAAFGINRPENDHRTAPSAMNWQEVDIYVALASGTFLYDAKANQLKLVTAEDVRSLTGSQPFVKDAPLNLVYVADYARISRASSDDRSLYTGADVGFIGQNVYLFCASEGLATVIRGSVEREPLSKALKLRAEQKIILAQTVGYPKK
jgi:SagB-type dehydrogenase family enzyme